jgi:hypothetical protein
MSVTGRRTAVPIACLTGLVLVLGPTATAGVRSDRVEPVPRGAVQRAVPPAPVRVADGSLPPQPGIPTRSRPRAVVAKLRISDTRVAPGERIRVSTRGSRARSGVKRVVIAFGDGTRTASRRANRVVTHAYRKAGSYRVSVTVTDRRGRRHRVVAVVFVVRPTAGKPLATGGLAPAVGTEIVSNDMLLGGEAALPASVNLDRYAVTPGNQGGYQSCGGWAVGYGLMGWLWRRAGNPSQAFAPMYLYSQTHLNGDGGSYSHTNLDILRDQGIDTSAHYGERAAYNDWQTQPTAAQRANAARHRISGWERVAYDGIVGATDSEMQIVKARLAGGRPVVVLMRWRSDASTNRNSVYYGTGTPGANHFMLALGYDSTGLWVQNSWGTDKGYGGFYKIAWSAVRNDLIEATSAFGLVTDSTGTDATKPTVSAIGKHFGKGFTSSSSGLPVTLSWSGSDNRGIVRYYAMARVNGTWTNVSLPSESATSATFNFAPGNTYSFAVTAQDAAGNWSDWSVTPDFRPSDFPEGNQSQSWSTGWQYESHASYQGGRAAYASAVNAWTTFTFTGTSVALVTLRYPGGGRARIYLDGVLMETIDTQAGSTQFRQVASSWTYPSPGTHVLEIDVEGTAGRPTVVVDSFLLM